MKPIIWLGNTLKNLREYPNEVRSEIGYNLEKVQLGESPFDWKSMHNIGFGVKEIRIHGSNEYRVLYVAKFSEAIYILNVFIKKTEKTVNREIESAKNNYRKIAELRKLI